MSVATHDIIYACKQIVYELGLHDNMVQAFIYTYVQYCTFYIV